MIQLKSINQIDGVEKGQAWGTTQDDRVIEVYPVFQTKHAGTPAENDDSYLYNPGASFVEVTADNWSGVRVCTRTESLNCKDNTK
jgi:hypothetical protein